VTWQITVSNTGPTDLNEVSLDDVNAPSCVDAFADAIAAAGWEIAGSLTMPSDESVTFECSSTVAASAPGSNTAVATGFDVLGRQVGPVQSTAFITRVAASGTIGDTVWYDTNANGVQDGSEPGIANVPVKLVANDGQDVDPVTAGVQTTITMTTNANGNYLFSGLPAGSYTVSVALSSVPNAGTTPLRFTTPGSYTIGLPDGGSVLTADFGVVADTLPVTGLSTDSILPVALLLLLAGAMAVFATRRKDHG
jgi:LPXTG-motif cell wall-anchored protein